MTDKSKLIKWFLSRSTINPSSGQHWDLLDGLRGMAILMVVACHGFYANPNGPKSLKLLADFIGAGAIGVQMFFVLSGFLISYPLLKAREVCPDAWCVPGYTTRRFLKIFPPFILCIILLVLIFRYVDGLYERAWLGLQWLVGIPHVLYVPDAPQFNGSFWSLWVEIGFYIILPIGILALRGKSVVATAVIITVVMFGVSTLTSFLTWPAQERESDYMLYIIGRFPNALSNFAWGVLFSALYISQRKKATGVMPLARFGYVGVGVLLAALLWTTWVVQNGLSSHWYTHCVKQLLADMATFLLLFFIFNKETAGARLLSAPWLKYLGIISYEWFLLHQPIINLARYYSGGAGGNVFHYLLIVITPILLTLIVAILIYHFFSAPIIEWGRRRIASKVEQKPAR